jgi:hypothetical protein
VLAHATLTSLPASGVVKQCAPYYHPGLQEARAKHPPAAQSCNRCHRPQLGSVGFRMPCEVAPLILASRARAGPAPPVPRDGQCGRERTTRTARRDVASQRVFALNGATGDGDGWGERDGAREGGSISSALPQLVLLLSTKLSADGPALRPDGPRSGRSTHVGRTVRACAEQIRVPSFVLRLLAKIMG